ncbi:MAG: NAD(P)-dependent alcohol dehydrogenase [Caldilineaceae bacterium]
MNSTQYALNETETKDRPTHTLQRNAAPVAPTKETHMNAVVFHEYGSPDVLTHERMPKPVPNDNEILVKVHATSANAGDWHLMRGDPFLIRLGAGLRKPKSKFLGADVAGQVEAVGSKVTQFQPGDAVFGDLSRYGFGAFAEYVAAPEDAFVLKPTNQTFAQAAAVPEAAVTALQALRDHGQLQAGQKVLINGASGGVGHFAVQIAKALGAEVTGVCSTRKMEMVRSIGADHVIDYTQEDFTQNGQQYDLILAVGGDLPISAYRRALRPQGRYVMIGGSSMKQFFQAMLVGPWLSMTGKQKLGLMLVKPTQADLAFVAELLETGKVVPVVDKTYPFSDLPDAIRYLEAGRAQGKVVITSLSSMV